MTVTGSIQICERIFYDISSQHGTYAEPTISSCHLAEKCLNLVAEFYLFTVQEIGNEVDNPYDQPASQPASQLADVAPKRSCIPLFETAT